MRLASPKLPPEAPPWLLEARKFAGCRELLGDGTLNPAVRDFFAVTSFPPRLINTKTAWCAAFACSCLEHVNIRSPRSAKAAHFLRWGVELDAPRLGCFLVFSRGLDPKSDQAHVGMYDPTGLAEDEFHYPVLGGNQKNCVSVAPYAKRRLLGIRWPAKPQAR